MCKGVKEIQEKNMIIFETDYESAKEQFPQLTWNEDEFNNATQFAVAQLKMAD